MQREIALALAHNVQRLMDHFGLSQAELGRRSGIAQRTISTLLDVENPSAINPRARTIEQLAEYFEVPAWQLQIPELPLELLLSKRMTKMIENYRDATDVGRSQVERIAEGEARYAAADSAITGHSKSGTGNR